MKNTAKAKIEQHLRERAQVRTIGAIRSVDPTAPIRLNALATELGLPFEKLRDRPGCPEPPNLDVPVEEAAVIIESALDQRADPDRILRVHAQREFDDMFSVR